jgi:hypothetical protein
MKKRRVLARLATLLPGPVLIVTLLQPAVAQTESRGQCVTAEVPAPMILPDGTAHPRGTLRLCFSEALSPVTGLHRAYVDGRFAGMFVSRRGTSEAPGEDRNPFLMFARKASGQLELKAYAIPLSDDRLRSYHVGPIVSGATAHNEAEVSTEATAPLVFLAALGQ